MRFSEKTYDNIKSHKNEGFHPLFRRHIFGKTAGLVNSILPTLFGLRIRIKCHKAVSKQIKDF